MREELGPQARLWSVKLRWTCFGICSGEGEEEHHKRNRSHYTHAPPQIDQNLCCLLQIYYQVSFKWDISALPTISLSRRLLLMGGWLFVGLSRDSDHLLKLVYIRKVYVIENMSIPCKSEINTKPSVFQNWTCCAKDRNCAWIFWSSLANVWGFTELLLRYLMNHSHQCWSPSDAV